MSLCDSLDDGGYAAVGVGNGQEALTYLRSGSPPCMIFLDLRMPVMNGWQFLAEVKRDPSAAKIPVVVITANGTVDRDSLDADELMLKPVKLDALLDAARRFCAC